MDEKLYIEYYISMINFLPYFKLLSKTVIKVECESMAEKLYTKDYIGMISFLSYFKLLLKILIKIDSHCYYSTVNAINIFFYSMPFLSCMRVTLVEILQLWNSNKSMKYFMWWWHIKRLYMRSSTVLILYVSIYVWSCFGISHLRGSFS